MLTNGDRPNPGWYPDPKGMGLRWWDGIRWTEATHEPPTNVTHEPAAECETDPLAFQISALVVAVLAIWIFWP